MKRWAVLGACLLTMVLGVSPALAEHEHSSPATPKERQVAPPEPGGQQPMAGQAPMGHGMMGQGMMGGAGMQCPMMARMHMSMVHRMMHQSMGGQTDPAMIGMAEAMAGSSMDTATMARMLQMRGEILKAIGDIMLRHGQAMAVEK